MVSQLGQRPRLRIDFTPAQLSGFAAVHRRKAHAANIDYHRTVWPELPRFVAHEQVQRRLANAAVGLLKPGGTLAYSTCTVNPLENEAMVRTTRPWPTKES